MMLTVGHHHRQHVADVACRLTLGHQQRPVGDQQPVIADPRDILGSEDALDSWQERCLRGSDSDHRCAGMAGKNESAVEHSFFRHVGNEILGAESLVLPAIAS